jgi:hypothetical protein
VVGNRWEPAAAVVAAVGEKGERREQQGKLGEVMGECLGAPSSWAQNGQGRHIIGRARCLGQHIPGPNLRPKWVRANAFGQRCLFASSCWADSFVRADAFGRALSVWVGPLEMP